MTPTRSLAAALALALGSVLLWTGCYSEPIAPSTYRYACDADADCNANETCRRGRCEEPCATLEVVVAGLLGADQPCTSADGIGVCVNGACSSTCALGSDYCSPGQTCLDVGLGSLGGGGSPFGGGSDEELGVCGFECDDELCAAGEECIEGVCQPIDCSLGQACPDGLGCFFGFCMAGCAGGQACPAGSECSPLFGVCEPTCEPACGDGELCFFGVCAIDCSAGQACPDDQACFFGVCALEQDATGTDTNGTGSDTAAMTDDGGSTAGTGATDATDDGSATGTTGMGVDPADHEDRR